MYNARRHSELLHGEAATHHARRSAMRFLELKKGMGSADRCRSAGKPSEKRDIVSRLGYRAYLDFNGTTFEGSLCNDGSSFCASLNQVAPS
jgi:hypothetical protein